LYLRDEFEDHVKCNLPLNLELDLPNGDLGYDQVARNWILALECFCFTSIMWYLSMKQYLMRNTLCKLS